MSPTRRPRAVRQPRQRLLAQRVFTGLDLDLKRGGLLARALAIWNSGVQSPSVMRRRLPARVL
jgi:hypothetical protein